MTDGVVAQLRSRAVGYAPYAPDLRAPGDRRRFAYWAQARGVPFTLARPGERFDVVVVSLAADLSWWRRLPRNAGRVVFDLTDAYLKVPGNEPRALLRGVAKFAAGRSRYCEPNFRRTLVAMCRRADAVVCTSEEIAADVALLNPNVHVVLDFIEDVLDRPKTAYAAGDPFRLVWDGLAENVGTFQVVASALEQVHRMRPLALDVITSPVAYRWMQRFGRRDTGRVLARTLRVPVRLHPWTSGAVARLAPAADAGIIPLPLDDPLRAGKSANKLVQYWRAGLPVVASATPTHRRVMDEAGVPMYAGTPAEWVELLTRCVSDEAFRRDGARRGRAYAEREHSEARKLAFWDAAMASVL